MYLTYEQFKGYGGKLDETDFNRFEFKAEQYLNKYTYDRLRDVPSDERVQRCTYELVTYIQSNNNGGSVKAVGSVSNDGYSVSYVGTKTADNEIYDIVRTYFINTDLMYAGTDAEIGKYKATAPEGYEYLLVRSEK